MRVWKIKIRNKELLIDNGMYRLTDNKGTEFNGPIDADIAARKLANLFPDVHLTYEIFSIVKTEN